MMTTFVVYVSDAPPDCYCEDPDLSWHFGVGLCPMEIGEGGGIKDLDSKLLQIKLVSGLNKDLQDGV